MLLWPYTFNYKTFFPYLQAVFQTSVYSTRNVTANDKENVFILSPIFMYALQYAAKVMRKQWLTIFVIIKYLDNVHLCVLLNLLPFGSDFRELSNVGEPSVKHVMTRWSLSVENNLKTYYIANWKSGQHAWISGIFNMGAFSYGALYMESLDWFTLTAIIMP